MIQKGSNLLQNTSKKNFIFHVSGGLCIGEKLLLNAEMIDWSFPTSTSTSKSVRKTSKNTNVTTTTARLKNIESKLFRNPRSLSPSSSSSSPSSLSSLSSPSLSLSPL